MAIKEIVEDAQIKIKEVLREAFSKTQDEYELSAVILGIFSDFEELATEAFEEWNKK